jgi:dGTP triphosphohydrolase
MYTRNVSSYNGRANALRRFGTILTYTPGNLRMATMIDTLGYVKKLTAAGFSREQAEAQAEAFRDDIATQVVTKADLDAGLTRLEHKIDDGLTRLEHKIDDGLNRLEHKIDDGLTRLDHKISNLEARSDGKFTLLHWMSGFTLALCLAMLWMMIRIVTGK